jgi:hypothetical protein
VSEEKIQEVLGTVVMQKADHRRKNSVDGIGVGRAVQEGAVGKVRGANDDEGAEDTVGVGAKLERELNLLGQQGHEQDRFEGNLSKSERFNGRSG